MRSRTRGGWLKKSLLIACATIGVLMAGAAVYAGYLYNKAEDALRSISGPVTETPGDAKKPEDSALKPMTFLITGIDRRQGSGGSLNADVIMVASLDPKTSTATILSLPRDIHLTPKGLPSHKANFYYAYYYNRDRDTALENTKRFYSEVLQIPIDYAAVIDFDGFRNMVDAVGGLTIDVDMDMRYVDTADGTNINLKKGVQKLNGKQTLDFVRYRKSNAGTSESSDVARNARQQQVLEQMLGKLTSFSGIAQWGEILDIAGKSVKTDIPEADLRDWITRYKQLKPQTIQFVTVEGKWESPYIVPERDDLLSAVQSMRTQAGAEPIADIELIRKLTDSIVVRSKPSTVTGSTYR